MCFQLFRRLYAQEPGRKTNIVKIEFGRLYQTLAEVRMMRTELEHDITGFQHGYPCFGRVVGNAAFRGKRGKVQQLSGASGAEAHKTLEGLQFLHLEDLPDITLKIGRHISAKPCPDGNIAIIERRVTAGVQHLVNILRLLACLRKLVKRKREQLHKGGSSRQNWVMFDSNPNCCEPVKI